MGVPVGGTTKKTGQRANGGGGKNRENFRDFRGDPKRAAIFARGRVQNNTTLLSPKVVLPPLLLFFLFISRF